MSFPMSIVQGLYGGEAASVAASDGALMKHGDVKKPFLRSKLEF